MKTNENELRMKNEALAKLAAKAKTGDQAAFTELYNRTSNDLFRCIRAMTRDEDLTWDIQQDSYLRAFQSLDKLENNEAFFPWLRRIAVNVTADRMKQRLPLTFTELTVEDDDGMPELPDLNPANQPELSLDRKETSRLVQEILSKLPEEQQLIVGMRYYDELSVKEIAGLLNISDGAVKAQLFHGRKKVETAVRALEKQGIKLYGLSPVAFLVALMRRAEPAAASGTRQAAVKAAVTKVSADAVAATAVPVSAKTFGQVLTGRLLAGALAVALIGGGIWGGAKLLKSQQRDKPYQPTTVVTSERLADVETPEELTETVETLPVVTEPDVTEPATTEAPEQNKISGTCGENLYWTYFPRSSKLILRGSGDMTDYADPQDAPWHTVRSQIKEIELPDELTAIGSIAFANCERLESVSIPGSVTAIGSNAFAYCESLKRVDIPGSVTVIGNAAFLNCTALERVNYQKQRNSLLRYGDHAFDGCTRYYCPTCPATFEMCEIGNYAFRGCQRYDGVLVCTETVTRIGDGAFADCGDLEEIWILGRDCAVGTAVVDPSVRLCAFPDSPAAQYAEQSACPFHPFVENRDEIVDLLEQGTDLRVEGVVPLDSRFLLKIGRSDRVTATEEEIQQARQTGTIEVNGVEYLYTESADQAEEWAGDSWHNGYRTDEAVAWICRANGGFCFYNVLRENDSYSFFSIWPCEDDGYLRTIQTVGWLWLDADNPYQFGYEIEETTMEKGNNYYMFKPEVVLLRLNDKGELMPLWHSSGRI